MRLKKLVLRNFGQYKGERILDLETRILRGRSRPIVLIGGRNGAGKTTLLEAVELCLYGRLALGSRVGEGQYHNYLREKIHRGRGLLLPIHYASVALEFDYAHAGRRFVYFIQRAWETNSSGIVTERLRILRDGESLSEIESEFWPEFVRSLVPPGVLHLFFFDGEKIKRLAEEETEAQTLADSVRDLLGLGLVEQLSADIDLYVSRQIKKTAKGTHALRLSEIESSEAEVVTSIQKLKEEEASHQIRLSALAQEIEESERQLADRGEGFAARRGELRQKLADTKENYSSIERRLREQCESPLPLAACPKLARQLLTQLDHEAEAHALTSARIEVDKTIDLVRERLVSTESPLRLSSDARAAIDDELTAIRQRLTERFLGAQEPFIHDLSDHQRDQVRSLLLEALGPARHKVLEFSNELVKQEIELRAIQTKLNQAPQEDEMTSIISRFSEFQQQHSGITLELALIAERRVQTEQQLIELRRERERLEKVEAAAKALVDRITLARRAQHTLRDYLLAVTTTKLQELESVALDCFRRLMEKRDLVQSIKIDPETFRVSLLDDRGRLVPKESLSAGEKQLYAISVLWALAKVSGRPLPIIIDTPLGRLDSHHRAQLLEHYFPFASHQVIILSTDTEVDRANFEQLRPYVSHCINLVVRDSATEVLSGYFWEEETVGGATNKENPVLQAG